MANLEGMQEKFIVIKNDDIQNYLTEYGKEQLSKILNTIEKHRYHNGKDINNTYLVINTDEPYADEIIKILKRNVHWGIEMKYYEFNQPYYALIKAESKETAINIYVEIITDDDDIEVKEVTKEYAWNAFKEVEEKFRSLEELKTDFESKEEKWLLIDGTLI